MTAQPLVSAGLDQVLAWTPDGARRVRDLLADAHALAAQLPGRHVVNACVDRYRFAVGFAACLIAGRTSLQPASQSQETLRRIRASYGDVVCLCDGEFDTAGLARLDYPRSAASTAVTAIPEIPGDQVAAVLFTSGSTGLPQPHRKTWGKLLQSARAEARALGLDTRPHAIVGTVPVQHSYGFESILLLALHAGCPIWAGKPFYPQDIVAALQSVPQPRMLVTTPFHLSMLLASGVALPAIDMLLSATAPLSAALAAEAEERCSAPLLEIYGSTESGQLASRRTTASAAWRLLPGVRLEQEEGSTFACDGHVEGRVALSDVVELHGEEFLLHGRQADMVDIAGRRSSLAYLNRQIASVPGVLDAAFFLPDAGTHDRITRLVAFVVAPGLRRKQLLSALRERIDAVLLPRPVVFVEKIPRDATGKLQRSDLQALYARHLETAGGAFRWIVPQDHPACEGHFPGNPIVPGVVLLDQAVLFAEQWLGRSGAVWRIENAKFLGPVGPGASLEFSLRPGTAGSVVFVVRNGSHDVASGSMKAL